MFDNIKITNKNFDITTVEKRQVTDNDMINTKNISKEENNKYNDEDMKILSEEVNNNISLLNSKLKFSYDQETKFFYVSIIDKDTDEIIRQIPSEEMIQLAKNMKEFVGIIFDEKG